MPLPSIPSPRSRKNIIGTHKGAHCAPHPYHPLSPLKRTKKSFKVSNFAPPHLQIQGSELLFPKI